MAAFTRVLTVPQSLCKCMQWQLRHSVEACKPSSAPLEKKLCLCSPLEWDRQQQPPSKQVAEASYGPLQNWNDNGAGKTVVMQSWKAQLVELVLEVKQRLGHFIESSPVMLHDGCQQKALPLLPPRELEMEFCLQDASTDAAKQQVLAAAQQGAIPSSPAFVYVVNHRKQLLEDIFNDIYELLQPVLTRLQEGFQLAVISPCDLLREFTGIENAHDHFEGAFKEILGANIHLAWTTTIISSSLPSTLR